MKAVFTPCMTGRISWQEIGKISLLTVVCYAIGLLSLRLDTIHPNAAVLWPMTGIAFTACLLWGSRMGVGVFFGALLVNITTLSSPFSSIGTSLGLTLGSITGAYLVTRFANGRLTFFSVRTIMRFMVFGVFVTSALTSVIGTFSITLFENTTTLTSPLTTMFTHFISNVVGITILTPLIVLWMVRAPNASWRNKKIVEICILFAVFAIVASCIFSGIIEQNIARYLWYAYVPLILWCTLRFSGRETVTTFALLSIISIWGTTRGLTPFIHTNQMPALYTLQIVIVAAGITAVSFSAFVSERKKTTETLSRQTQELVEIDIRKDEFLAILSHELRNPLTPILHALDLISTRDILDDKLKKFVGVIDRQTRHLSRLLNDLLDVSRMSRGKISLHLELVDVVSIVTHAIEGVHSLIQESEQHLEITHPTEPIKLVADPLRLEQIVTNILLNASKYTPRLGTIRVDYFLSQPNELLIRIQDTGIGIEAGMLAKIFEKFVQVSPGDTKSGGGLGVGLVLAQSIARLHGGDVKVESPGLGKGSTFSIYLPAKQDVAITSLSPRRHTVPFSSAQTASYGKRVLVIDDYKDLADTLGFALQHIGCDVSVQYSGYSGLQELERFIPDFVFLDIGLPDISGYEVAKTIKARYGTRLTLIALSGYGQEEDKQLARDAGFDDYLVKPVGVAELQAVVTKYSRGFQMSFDRFD